MKKIFSFLISILIFVIIYLFLSDFLYGRCISIGYCGIPDVKFQFKNITIRRTVNMIQKFPKFFFEVIVVVAFTSYIYLLSFNDQDINKIIPQIGIFFLAVIRILPAVSKIIIHFNKL